MTPRELAESLAVDASTERFQPSLLDVLDWVYRGDLRFANFLPLKQEDPRLEQLRQMLLPRSERTVLLEPGEEKPAPRARRRRR